MIPNNADPRLDDQAAPLPTPERWSPAWAVRTAWVIALAAGAAAVWAVVLFVTALFDSEHGALGTALSGMVLLWAAPSLLASVYYLRERRERAFARALRLAVISLVLLGVLLAMLYL